MMETKEEKKLPEGFDLPLSDEEEKTTKRKLKGSMGKMITVIAVAFSLFQVITGYAPLVAMYQRLVHVAFAFTLIFLLYPFSGKGKKDRHSW